MAGIVEANEAARQAIGTEYGDCEVLAGVDEALKRDFEGFVVATPAETHFEIAKLLLVNRKPALVEKPISLRSSEARELQRLAIEHETPLMVGHVLLFHPAIIKVKELIDAGKIGRLEYLYSNRLNLGTVRTEENILWSFAPHDLSIFQYFINASPLEVVSRGGAYLQPGIHDTTLTILSYPENIVGHIFVSWLHPFKEHRLLVIGSEGMLSFEDSSEQKRLVYYEKGIDWVQGAPIKRDGPTESIEYDATPPLTRELEYFASKLDSHEPIEPAGAAGAIEVLEILEKATESLLEKPAASTAGSENNSYFVHASSYVDDGVTIGEGSKIWHFSHVQGGAEIGKDCSIGQNVNVGNNVKIGNSVKIQNNVSIYEGVELEDYVFCGPSMVFTNVMDPRSKYPQRGTEHYRKTLVQEGASIGANATIVCGHTIGRHCFIAAGAVVTGDVAPYALMAGVPAVRKAWMCECGEKLGAEENEMTCARCAKKYELKEGRLALHE